MYRRESSGWGKHYDFIILDLICLQLALLLSYVIRGLGYNPYVNILYRRSVRQRIPRPFTGRLLRPQAEAMIIRGMRQEEMPITGTYGMERSRLPITESTISVIFPSSASSPSRALRRWRALPFRKSGIFSPE